jgi:glutamate racemase
MIGVFDSGFGGLTILKEFINVLPEYDYLYLGDNARTPYGNRSADTVYNYTVEAVEFLFKKNCELIIIACNTASALALKRIQQEWLVKNYPEKRVLGIIRPLAEGSVKQGDKIGVVGTRGTINSNVYEKELKKLNPKVEVFCQACPLLVPLIEEGYGKKPETKMILRKYLSPLKEKKIDSLILGCTHYPIIKNLFEKKIGKNVKVLDSGKIVAKSLKNYLKRHSEIEGKLGKNKKRVFYTTDSIERFDNLGSKFFGQKVASQKIDI